MTPMYIAVDVGGTNTRVVGSQSLDKPIFVGEPVRRRNSKDYDADLAFIVEAARNIGGDSIDALGIGVVGTLNDSKTSIVTSNNNPEWISKPFVAELRRQLGCPVFAENDAVAAGLGEAQYSETTGDFAYIVWGTGVGGLVIEHKGSVLHVNDINSPYERWKYYFGEWEQDCGGSKLAMTHKKQPEDFTNTEWAAVFTKFTQHAEVFVGMMRPKAIVFAGGLSIRHKQELAALSDVLGIPCRASSFDNDSGLYGGFALIKTGLQSEK